MSSNSSDNINVDAETCVICLESLVDNGDDKTLECNHVFHKECLTHWEDNSNLCPTCRHPIKSPMIALKEALSSLAQAANSVSIAAIKLKTVTRSNVGHLPMAIDAIRNIEEMSSNIGQVAHLLSPNEASYSSASSSSTESASSDIERLISTLLTDTSRPTINIRRQRQRPNANEELTHVISNIMGSMMGRPSFL